MKRIVLVYLLTATLGLAGLVRANEPETEPLMARGRQAVAAAFKELSQNLQRAIFQGGVTNAVSFCAEQAQPTTSAVGRKERMVIRRVSQRPRNPANETSDTERG